VLFSYNHLQWNTVRNYAHLIVCYVNDESVNILLRQNFQGEEYKLFWPDEAEFVRMAALFGATIIPFGCVGEDDFLEVPILSHKENSSSSMLAISNYHECLPLYANVFYYQKLWNDKVFQRHDPTLIDG